MLLSGLRFLLATIVILDHCRPLIPDKLEAPVYIKMVMVLGGPPSVYGFFLVSGYSIAASVQRERRGFYRRRFARIYPVYWACFAIALLALSIVGKSDLWARGQNSPPVWAIALNAIGLPCLLAGAISTFGPSWSLTCEIIYYALAPYLSRCSDRILILLASLSFCYFIFLQTNLWPPSLYGTATAALAWFWLSGFVFYRQRANPLAAPLFVGLTIVGYSLNWNWVEPFACVNLLISTLAIVYATEVHLPDQMSRFLTYLGNLSYPIYLVHASVYAILYYYLRNYTADMTKIIIIYPILAVISAIAIYHFVDLPSRKFVLKLFGFKNPAATTHECKHTLVMDKNNCG